MIDALNGDRTIKNMITLIEANVITNEGGFSLGS